MDRGWESGDAYPGDGADPPGAPAAAEAVGAYRAVDAVGPHHQVVLLLQGGHISGGLAQFERSLA